jgi:hypothetical protein
VQSIDTYNYLDFLPQVQLGSPTAFSGRLHLSLQRRMCYRSLHRQWGMGQEKASVASQETKILLVVASAPRQREFYLLHLPRFHTLAMNLSNSLIAFQVHYRYFSKIHYCAHRSLSAAMRAGCSLLQTATLPSPTPSLRTGSQSDVMDKGQSLATGRVRCFRARNLAEMRLKKDGRRTGPRFLRSWPSLCEVGDGNGCSLA